MSPAHGQLGRWDWLWTWQYGQMSCAEWVPGLQITRQSVRGFTGPFASPVPLEKCRAIELGPQATLQVPNSPSRVGQPSLAAENSFAETFCTVPVARQLGSVREMGRKRAWCWQAGCRREGEGTVAARAVKLWHLLFSASRAHALCRLCHVVAFCEPALSELRVPGREWGTEGLPHCCHPLPLA